MKLRSLRLLSIIFAFFIMFSVPGVYALWRYFSPATPSSQNIGLGLNNFTFGPEEILYISNVEMVSVNGSINNHTYSYSKPTNVSISGSVSRQNTQITYKITVHNNTDVSYWYHGAFAVGARPSNSLIAVNGGITLVTKDKQSDGSATFDKNDWVPPRTTRDFYVIYTYGGSATGSVDTCVNFKFGLQMDAVYDGFLKILNDKNSDNGYYYLAEEFDKQYAENKSTVLGNVGADKAIFDRLFGEDLTIDINGVDTPVTVLVERKNVDKRTTGDAYSGNGPSGCEYTVYITVDSLDSPTGQAMVYAISYSCNSNGVWYQLGELYEGTANIEDYDSSDNVYQGSFDVDSWIATPNTYEIEKDIYYKVGQLYQGTNYDKLKTIEEIMSTDDNEIYNKIDNSGVLKETYNILTATRGSTAPEVLNLNAAFTAMEPYFNNYNNGQQFQMKRNCPRAEIIPYILNLCKALDYYYQVHT